MTETIIFFWLVQTFGIGMVGTMRKCGFFRAALMSLFFGPLVAGLYVVLSDRVERK